ncbi:hypothetical protein ACXL2B_005202, partial [Escherichia coli]
MITVRHVPETRSILNLFLATDQLRDLDIHRSLKHTTEPVQNTDFLKPEKLLLSEQSVRNTIGITVSANFPVAVFIRHIT